MSSVIKELLALSEIDMQLVAYKRRFEAGPEELRQQKQAAESMREARREIEGTIKQKIDEVNQANLDMRTAEAEVEDQERKLKAIKNNKEYKIVTERIKALKQTVSDLENRALAVMEELDTLRATHKARQDEIVVHEQKQEETVREVEAEAKEIRDQVEVLKGQRQSQIERVQALDPDAMAVYSLALRRAGGDAMAEMREGVCQTCFRRQTSNVENLVLVGREIKKCICAGCGRILIVKEAG